MGWWWILLRLGGTGNVAGDGDDHVSESGEPGAEHGGGQSRAATGRMVEPDDGGSSNRSSTSHRADSDSERVTIYGEEHDRRSHFGIAGMLLVLFWCVLSWYVDCWSLLNGVVEWCGC